MEGTGLNQVAQIVQALLQEVLIIIVRETAFGLIMSASKEQVCIEKVDMKVLKLTMTLYTICLAISNNN